MPKLTIETYVPATTYEDCDDCLEAARRDYAEEHGFALWEVEARYASEQRDEIVITAPECHCQCGAVTGERCAWSGPRADTIEIQWVRPDRRGTAKAAGSAAGLAERLRLHEECAALIIETTPDWAWLGSQA